MFNLMSALRLRTACVKIKLFDSHQQTHPAKSPTLQSALPASRKDEIITVAEGETIPFDGIILEGAAFIDESAMVGVSTPAFLSDETGRNNVIGGTVVVEGTLKIQRS